MTDRSKKHAPDDFSQMAALALCERNENPLNDHARATRMRHWRRIDALRRESQRPAKERLAASTAGDRSRSFDPAELAILAEEHETLSLAIRELPIKYRQAIVVIDLRELAFEAAARELRVTVSALKSRHRRARAELAMLVSAALGSSY